MTIELRDAVVSAIGVSLDGFRNRFPDESIACYAVVTDNDLGSLYGAICTTSRAEDFDDSTYRFRPAEWDVEDTSSFKSASKLIRKIVDQRYSKEGPEIGPDDDHLRPWKAELFGIWREHSRSTATKALSRRNPS
ncbi:MAG: DUF4303 domain-containing protein [Myxococcota bacterium]